MVRFRKVGEIMDAISNFFTAFGMISMLYLIGFLIVKWVIKSSLVDDSLLDPVNQIYADANELHGHKDDQTDRLNYVIERLELLTDVNCDQMLDYVERVRQIRDKNREIKKAIDNTKAILKESELRRMTPVA